MLLMDLKLTTLEDGAGEDEIADLAPSAGIIEIEQT